MSLQCHFGTKLRGGGSDSSTPACALTLFWPLKRDASAVPQRGLVLFRIAVITAFCGLLLAPLWVANDGVDRLFASQGGQPSSIAPSSGSLLPGVGEDVLSRLHDVRSEIRADICRRGETRYCLGGLCLPVPAQGCVRS